MVVEQQDANRLFLHGFSDRARGLSFLNVGHLTVSMRRCTRVAAGLSAVTDLFVCILLVFIDLRTIRSVILRNGGGIIQVTAGRLPMRAATDDCRSRDSR